MTMVPVALTTFVGDPEFLKCPGGCGASARSVVEKLTTSYRVSNSGVREGAPKEKTVHILSPKVYYLTS